MYVNIDDLKPWANGFVMFERDRLQLELKLIGGVVLPSGLRPGACVLLAQEKHQLASLSVRRLYLVDGFEETELDLLLAACLDFSRKFEGSVSWCAALGETARVALHGWNRVRQAQGLPQLFFRNAPLFRGTDAEASYCYGLGRIRERTAAGKKTLELGEVPEVGSALSMVPAGCADGKGLEAYPIVAALAICVASADFYESALTDERPDSDEDSGLGWHINPFQERKSGYGRKRTDVRNY